MLHENVIHPTNIDQTAPVGLVLTDLDGIITEINPYMVAMLAVDTADLMIGSRIDAILTPAARIYFTTQLHQLIHHHGGFTEVALILKWGDADAIDVLISAARYSSNVTYAIFPATARRGREREFSALRAATETKNKLLMQIETIALIGAWTVDLTTRTMTWSDAVYKIYELPLGEPVDIDIALSGFPEKTRRDAMKRIERPLHHGETFEHESEFVTLKGKNRWVRSLAEVEFFAGKPVRLLGVLQDVTEQHLAQKKLWQLAHYDPLTGLANRTLFQKVLDDELQRALETGSEVFLIMLDLDGFKVVNDALGHNAGDIVLKAISRRITGIQGSRLCGRLGGDEFVIILTDLNEEQVHDFAHQILKVAKKPIKIANHECAITVSIGIASFPDNGQTVKTLLKRADLALYEAKYKGKGLVIQFRDNLEIDFDTKQADLLVVQKAVAAGTLKPYYQPKVDLASGEIIGFEALARIENVDGTIMTPVFFASAFTDERGSLMIHDAILGHLLRDLRAWLDAGLNPGVISFNLAEAALKQQDFQFNFLRQVSEAGISTRNMMIEITETAFLGRDTGRVKTALTDLKNAGCEIALDDFGTGFASLSHLRDFPIDKIKIDKTFILGLGQQEGNEAIVSAIIGLAHKLDIKVIAEGIENSSHLSFLRQVSCDSGQGYLFSKAIPAAAVEKLLSASTPYGATGTLIIARA